MRKKKLNLSKPEYMDKNRYARRVRRLHSIGYSLREPPTAEQVMLDAERHARNTGWHQIGTTRMALTELNGVFQWLNGKVPISQEAAKIWLKKWLAGDRMPSKLGW